MTHELRRLLEEELADETPPPLGDVVRVSVDSGRRVRRRRRLLAGAGGGTAAAVLAVTGLFALGAPPAPTGQAAAPPSPSPVTVVSPQSPAPTRSAVPAEPARCVVADPAPRTSVAATADPRPTQCPSGLEGLDLTLPSAAPTSGEFDKTTPGSALELLTQLLPKGKTGEYAYLPDGFAHVQLYLDRGEGFGMIRLLVDTVETPVCLTGQTCLEVAGTGLVTVESDARDCTRFLTVGLQRADGVRVTLQVADCLMWDGRHYPAGEIALTPQEAVTVVLNPVWGPTMPVELIKAGQHHFAKLDTIAGG